VEVNIVQLANCASHAGAKEVGHEVDIVAGKMSMVGEMALIKGALESLIIGVNEEMVKLSSFSCSLDLFFRKVSALSRYVEWSTIAPDAPENPLVTAVGGGFFQVRT